MAQVVNAKGFPVDSQAPRDWPAVFAQIDEVGFGDDFLADRQQDYPQQREALQSLAHN